ncbi:DUF2254 domain-containing protein [Dyadobacter tibetensis]|uniref:DUF2254 domain-containing protein n=1 Tax=Dyadobacter tibetensis TaxID=1211851 RepID=UPI00046F8B69|nr:DUF2254 domain-containing protein [Dyadobacter tibetensis]
MKTKIRYFLDALQSSFWFLPLVIIFAAMGMAFLLLFVDGQWSYMPTSGLIWFILSGGAESARTVLSTIASAMLGMATTVFSITLVVLTLASSQFGPRLLRNFMYDRLNQVVLGTFIATFVFCLIVLKAVHSESDYLFVPNLSILFAELLTIGNVILLIIFIHHTSVSIQADKVISDISQQLVKAVRKELPNNDQKMVFSEQKNFEQAKETYLYRKTVRNEKNGYLQAIDYDSLVDFAEDHGLMLEMHYRPGDFLIAGVTLALINGHKPVTENESDAVIDSLIIGKIRSPAQDVEFAIHQLVEIAARALSPGVNDPYTALTCIDQLTVPLSYMAQIHFPQGYLYDSKEVVRVSTKRLSFDGAMDAAYNLIRQYGTGSPTILIRLMERFYTMYLLTEDKSHKQTILRHAKMVHQAGKDSITEANDLHDLQERFGRFE